MGVGPHEGLLLSQFGAYVKDGLGHRAYQVGSSLTQKGGWRDVDVRVLMDDDEFDALFAGPGGRRKLAMWNLAWTMLGRHITRLPIDFQIQRLTDANDQFGGVRSALGIFAEPIPTPEGASDALVR